MAAYSDSESEGEKENVDISPENPKKKINSKLQVRDETPLFEIEDEDEWEQSVPTTTSTDQLDDEKSAEIFSSLPAPSTSNFSLKEEEEENEDEFLRKKPNKEDVLFKKEQALLEKELKENKKNSGSKDSKHFLSKFTMGGSKKKHVMISIPTLEEV